MVRQVLLSAKLDGNDQAKAMRQLAGLSYPVMVSPKVDGIRCYINDKPLLALSRKNKPIPNSFIQQALSKEVFRGMDGELTVGSPVSKTCYNTTQSGVMSQDGQPTFRFCVFDQIDPSGVIPFEHRYDSLVQRIDVIKYAHTHVRLVPHHYVYSVEELLAYELKMVTKGWEGIMIRSPLGIYKQGRSTLNEEILIKVKRFQDSEAEVLGAYEQETNLNEATINEVGRSKRSSHQENKIPNGHLGGFYARDLVSGVEFEVGTFYGVTKESRKVLWDNFKGDPKSLLGKIIKYKFFPIGVKDKPRQPIFLGWRNSGE